MAATAATAVPCPCQETATFPSRRRPSTAPLPSRYRPVHGVRAFRHRRAYNRPPPEPPAPRSEARDERAGEAAAGRNGADAVHLYLRDCVDPLLSGVILHVLARVPEEDDVPGVVLGYLRGVRDGRSDAAPARGAGIAPPQRSLRSTSADRLRVARDAAPVFSGLASAALAARPDDVLAFLIATMELSVADAGKKRQASSAEAEVEVEVEATSRQSTEERALQKDPPREDPPRCAGGEPEDADEERGGSPTGRPLSVDTEVRSAEVEAKRSPRSLSEEDPLQEDLPRCSGEGRKGADENVSTDGTARSPSVGEGVPLANEPASHRPQENVPRENPPRYTGEWKKGAERDEITSPTSRPPSIGKEAHSAEAEAPERCNPSEKDTLPEGSPRRSGEGQEVAEKDGSACLATQSPLAGEGAPSAEPEAAARRLPEEDSVRRAGGEPEDADEDGGTYATARPPFVGEGVPLAEALERDDTPRRASESPEGTDKDGSAPPTIQSPSVGEGLPLVEADAKTESPARRPPEDDVPREDLPRNTEEGLEHTDNDGRGSSTSRLPSADEGVLSAGEPAGHPPKEDAPWEDSLRCMKEGPEGADEDGSASATVRPPLVSEGVPLTEGESPKRRPPEDDVPREAPGWCASEGPESAQSGGAHRSDDAEQSSPVNGCGVPDAEAAAPRAESSTRSVPPPIAEPPPQPRKIAILLAGIDGAGKSTLLAALRGDANPRCRPSLGFKPVSMGYGPHATIKFYDLGGGPKIRAIWENYYHDVHGAVYVVDAVCDEARLEESARVAKATLGHRYLQGKPCLTICNKTDVPSARPTDAIQRELGLSVREEGGGCKIVAASAHPQKAGHGGETDPAINAGLEWLIKAIIDDFDALTERVAEDTEKVVEAHERERAEKERRVMATSIRKAFGLEGENESTDAFGREEGEEFLAQEIGLEGGAALPREGHEVAALVGYQKLALMMVGGKVAPIGRHKEPWSWQQVIYYVEAVRAEIQGLPPVSTSIAVQNQVQDQVECPAKALAEEVDRTCSIRE